MTMHSPATPPAGPERLGESLRPVSARDHGLGAPDAPVTLLVYGDYECPYTRAVHLAIWRLRPRLEADGPALRFVFRHFPLRPIHLHAQHAAEAAEAAYAQGGDGAFWAIHDLLFHHQDALDDAHLAAHAGRLGLDAAGVAAALRAGTHADRVEEDVRSGVRSGVRGTPTLFIDGARYEGPRDAATLARVLREQRVAPGADRASGDRS